VYRSCGRLLNPAAASSWGEPFLHHTYFYHIGRLDHRHNFSAYFYPIYQAMFTSDIQEAISSYLDTVSRVSRHPIFAFVPQMFATLGAGFVLSWKYDQEFAWFIQTVVFVTFNKVCTSQVGGLASNDCVRLC
jgi:phosphatidylinositol glycan class M